VRLYFQEQFVVHAEYQAQLRQCLEGPVLRAVRTLGRGVLRVLRAALDVYQVILVAPILDGPAQRSRADDINLQRRHQADQQVRCRQVQVDLRAFVQYPDLDALALERKVIGAAVRHPALRGILILHVQGGDFDARLRRVARCHAANEIASLQSLGARGEREHGNQAGQQDDHPKHQQ